MVEVYPSLQLFYGLGLHEDSRLLFTDLEWIPKESFGGSCYWEFHPPDLTAFAFTARRDEWALYPPWGDGPEPPVLFCEKGDTGFVYAGCFADALVRMLVEDLAGNWLLEHCDNELDRVDRLYRSYPELLSPLIGRERGAAIERILDDHHIAVNGNGNAFYMPREKANVLVERLCPYRLLNHPFIHDPESPDFSGWAKPTPPN